MKLLHELLSGYLPSFQYTKHRSTNKNIEEDRNCNNAIHHSSPEYHFHYSNEDLTSSYWLDTLRKPRNLVLLSSPSVLSDKITPSTGLSSPVGMDTSVESLAVNECCDSGILDAYSLIQCQQDINGNSGDYGDVVDSSTLSSEFSMLDMGMSESTTRRTVNEISSSLVANIARLRRDRNTVDEAFNKARSEEKLRVRELMRIKRQVAEARCDVLIATLKKLNTDLNKQCHRLQAAYDTVLAARWPQLHSPN